MLNQISRFTIPPVFEDEDKTRIARLLHWVVLIAAGLNVLDMVLLLIFAPETLPTFWANLVFLIFTGVSYWMTRQGRVQAAGLVLCVPFWLVLTYYLSVSGGVTSPALGILSIVIITGAVLLGVSGALTFGALCIASALVLFWAGDNGWLTLVEGPPTPARLFATQTIILLGLTILMGLSERNVHASLTRAWESEKALAAYNGQLQREIAERKQIEEAYRVLVEHSVQGLVIFQDNRIVFVNPRMCDMLGYSADELLALDDPISAIVHPDDRTLVSETLAHYLAGVVKTSNTEFRAIHKQGGELWLESFSAQITYQGKPAIQSASIEITHRKRAEERLRQSEEEFRQLSDAALEGIAITDEGCVILANNQVAHMLGYEHAELVGRQVMDFVAPESRDLVLQHIQTGYDKPYDHLALRRDGSVFPVEVLGRVMTYHGRTVRVTALRDISERKQAEQALKHSEERFARAFHSSPIPITISTLDEGRFIDVNQSCLNSLGYQREEMVGHTVVELETWADITERHEIVQLLQREGTVRQREIRFRTRAGEVRYALASFEIIELNATPYILGSWLDMTDIKQAEKQALELALAQERETNLRDFLSTISHDLKTPLSVINTSLYFLERMTDPVKQQERIEAIRAQAQLLERYIQDILTISRLDHTPMVKRSPVDLNRLLRDILTRLSPSTEQKGLTTNLDLSQALTAVPGDQNELDRVLVNLIENAVTYTPTNGSIIVRTRTDGQWAVAEISDTGIGIGEADLPHVFERFYRASEAKTIEKRGTGLGLAIARKIVELHEGNIEVQSVAGQGTTFSVRLPLA